MNIIMQFLPVNISYSPYNPSILKLEAKVEKLYPVYHSCSQPTLAALNDQFGLNADQTVTAIKLFAGGVVGKGETCGAVTGSLLAIGFNFKAVCMAADIIIENS